MASDRGEDVMLRANEANARLAGALASIVAVLEGVIRQTEEEDVVLDIARAALSGRPT